MCNLYSVTTNQQAIRQFVSITHDVIGNVEPSLGCLARPDGTDCPQYR